MKTINKHEEQYWHIPKFSILPILGLILFISLAYLNFFLIDTNTIRISFKCNADSCNLIPSDLINIYPIIGEYILICLIIISLVALFKKGYRNLKRFDEKGLIFGLISGLIIGLIFGLISGLIIGLIYGLISGLIFGLIYGLISGLIITLIYGLIIGLTKEFER